MVLVLMANTMMTRVCILFYLPSHRRNLVVDALGFNYLFHFKLPWDIDRGYLPRLCWPPALSYNLIPYRCSAGISTRQLSRILLFRLPQGSTSACHLLWLYVLSKVNLSLK